MEDFNLPNSALDWGISKVCDKLLNIAQKYILQFNVDAERKNFRSKLQVDREFIEAEIPTLSLNIDKEELTRSLERRLTFAENWCKTVNFTDLKRAKHVFKIFVDLNLYLTVRRVHIGRSNEPTIPLTKVIDDLNSHLILLGGPGAGKTTISKYLCLQLIERQQLWTKNFSYPLVIRFRDIDDNNPGLAEIDDFYAQVLSYLGVAISVNFKQKEGKIPNSTLRDQSGITKTFRNMIVEILDYLRTIVVLEGLDEIPNIGNYTPYLLEIQKLMLELKHTRILLTSRTGIFHNSIENAETYEIAPLTDDQIELFVRKWIEEEQKADQLLIQLQTSIYKNTSVRPINIAHLCAIFERYGEIPSTPKDVYRKIVGLLSEEWDAQRQITRKSQYDKFPIERKTDFLKQIAYLLTIKFGGLTFTDQQLRYCYEKIHSNFGLPKDQMDKVLNEIESHTGLFAQSGYCRYEFSHKSIQEYLTADAIVRIPFETLGSSKLIQLPNELAICTALSYSPNTYFALLILREFGPMLVNFPFTGPFLKRLMDEKPEFNDYALLALAIIKLIEYNEVRNAGKNFELQQEHKLIITFIHSHPNIKPAFANLANYYFDASKSTIRHCDYSNNRIDPDTKFTLSKKNGFAEFEYAKLPNSIVVKWPVYKLIYLLED